MELQQIVDRYAECLEYVDANTTTRVVNTRQGRNIPYHLGLHALGEERAFDQADEAWDLLYPGEILEPLGTRMGLPYPNIPRTRCDHVFSTIQGPQPEWAIEQKFISFVGDNGNNNDYGVGKMLSPYLKDRGVLHDAARLRGSEFTERVAVVMYCFNYDFDICDRLEELHPNSVHVVDNIRSVVEKNAAPLHAEPVIELLESILAARGYLRGRRAQAEFDAWRSPAGGPCTVFGWEVRRPHLEPGYDARHPW